MPIFNGIIFVSLSNYKMLHVMTVDLQTVLDGIQAVITFIQAIQDNNILDKVLRANAEAALNNLRDIEESEDPMFIHDGLNRSLSQLEPIYYALMQSRRKSQKRTINDVCYHITLCHRLLSSPNNIIYKWGVQNLIWDDDVYGYDKSYSAQSVRFILGDSYEKYTVRCTMCELRRDHMRDSDEFELSIEDIRAHMP